MSQENQYVLSSPLKLVHVMSSSCVSGGRGWACAPLKFGKNFFGQLVCEIRAFFGQKSCKIREFCKFFGHISLKFRYFDNFSGKNHVKFGHFADFNTYFSGKNSVPPS